MKRSLIEVAYYIGLRKLRLTFHSVTGTERLRIRTGMIIDGYSVLYLFTVGVLVCFYLCGYLTRSIRATVLAVFSAFRELELFKLLYPESHNI